MDLIDKIQAKLPARQKRWLITGVAGFIGSNLLETLLNLDQTVVGLDNFLMGKPENLDEVRGLVGEARWRNFRFIEGDIRDAKICNQVTTDIDFVLHQAALGSVPRSIEDPMTTNEINISGFMNVMDAARRNGVARFVYAASSSTYGDSQELPKKEGAIGRPLSPYAVTKYVNELYAGVYALNYGLQSIGLRYFNVFGRRQDPDGAYAAVIPKWFRGFIAGEQNAINGDGETSRDFCYIDNCVQANILAATVETPEALNTVYNVAHGHRTTLNALFALILAELRSRQIPVAHPEPAYRPFREGDVRHSLADISKAEKLLGYRPECSVTEGLAAAAEWYIRNLK